MSDPLSLYDPEPELSKPAIVGPKPPGAWETMGAAARVASDEVGNTQNMRLRHGYAELIQQIATGLGKDPKEYYNWVGSLWGDHYDLDKIWSDAIELRGTDPRYSQLPYDRAEFEKGLLTRQGRRAKDQQTVSEGGAIPGFIGGMAGAMTDPFNIATTVVSGGGNSIPQMMWREAAVNGIAEAVQQPAVAANRAALGEELTGGEAVQNVLMAAGGGALLSGLIGVAGRYGGRAWEKLTPLEKRLAKALEAEQIADPAHIDLEVTKRVLGRLDDSDLVALARSTGADATPTVGAAVSLAERQLEMDAGNPYIAGSGDTYADRLSLALESVLRSTEIPDYAAVASRAGGEPPLDGRSAIPSRGLDGPGGPVNPEALKAAIRGPESGGDDGATNGMGSSASGRYQFTEGTFKGYYRKVYGGGAAAADAAWRNQRFDVGVQERLMDALIADNAATLRRAGIDTTTGNMYVMHVLGSGDGPKLLQAAPDTPVARILSAEVIRGNPAYFGGGKSASEAIAAMHRKVGGRAASVPAGRGGMGADADGIGDAALLRDEAMRLRSDAAAMTGADGQMGLIFSRGFDPAELGIDAARMQFKRGADAEGVTAALRDVDRWDPALAGRAVVWEGADGRLVVADGHQRVALAKRTGADRIDATVLREADGWDAESVRVWSALKNVVEGSADAVDAARVMRGMTAEHVAAFIPPRSALARDAEGLARLGDDAFAAADAIDPGHAAIVGRIASDPGEQKALIDLLTRLRPASQGEAEAMVKRGMKAGFNEDGSIRNVEAIEREHAEMARPGADAADGGGAGRRGRRGADREAVVDDGAVGGYPREPDPLDGGWPRLGDAPPEFPPMDAELGRLFDDASSDGAKLQVESLQHDALVLLREAADEAGQPKFLVDLGDGPVDRTLAQMLEEFAADDAAIKAAKACL